jgi:hypothetical protein
MKHRIIREPKGYKTITEMFERSAKEYSNRVMSKIKRGGVWREYTLPSFRRIGPSGVGGIWRYSGRVER